MRRFTTIDSIDLHLQTDPDRERPSNVWEKPIQLAISAEEETDRRAKLREIGLQRMTPGIRRAGSVEFHHLFGTWTRLTQYSTLENGT